MPDLTDLPALDIAIGLAFLYFLLSVICSSISEIIASLFRIRARNLETGIRVLLGSKDAADRFYANWRIKSLGTPKWRSANKDDTSRRPSYLPADTFALAVLDTFAPDVGKEVKKADPKTRGPIDVLTEVQATVAKLDNEVARQRLDEVLLHARGNIDTFRKHLEAAFNDVMDRATGWYKRKVQIILFFVALAVAGGLNADTLNVGDRLARDEALRARVVAQAERAARENPEDSDATPTAADVEKQIEQARATALPLGWSEENVQNGATAWVILVKSAGILFTAVAVMLGAPFWFDVLGKFARLRSSGNRIGTPKDDNVAPTDRDDRLKRGAPDPALPGDRLRATSPP
jgi:hypothetical protein